MSIKIFSMKPSIYFMIKIYFYCIKTRIYTIRIAIIEIFQFMRLTIYKIKMTFFKMWMSRIAIVLDCFNKVMFQTKQRSGTYGSRVRYSSCDDDSWPTVKSTVTFLKGSLLCEKIILLKTVFSFKN